MRTIDRFVDGQIATYQFFGGKTARQTLLQWRIISNRHIDFVTIFEFRRIFTCIITAKAVRETQPKHSVLYSDTRTKDKGL